MFNYKDLNLKIGLEIHYQLETHKLFCNCPSILREDEPDIKIKRKLIPVPSETGEKDVVAEFELKKNKYAVYEAYSNTTCELELDECPPFEINKHALQAALQISKLLNCKIVQEVQVMRKQVLDFSNTSGFQRSALIAYNGSLNNTKIQTICLEEDAARKIKETKNYIIFRLDRLGIPLIEITTSPTIKTPEQAKQIAEQIGMIVKSTGKNKKGIGTVRQDLNISILKNPRVEIKGVQNLKSIPKVIKNEIKRQLLLIKKNKKINAEVRKVNPDLTTSFLRPMPGAARLYPETDILPIKTKPLLKLIKLPELISEKTAKLEKKYKLQPEIARAIIKQNINLEYYTKKFPRIPIKFIANTLTLTLKDIKKRYKLDVKKIKQSHIEKIFSYLNSKKILQDAVEELLIEVCKNKKININKYKPIQKTKIKKEIKELIKKNKNLTFQALMGILMSKYKGKIQGKELAKILRENVRS